MGQLPEGTNLCTIEVAGLYNNIRNHGNLSLLKDFKQQGWQADHNRYFDRTCGACFKRTTFLKFLITYKLIRRTAIMAALEEKLMIFYWEHAEEGFKKIINDINSFHPTITFTADWTKEKAYFLDVEVTLQNGVMSTDLLVKTNDISIF